MRFLADGPDIPDDLLEACDDGRVVFFCGAGVSLPIMPNFLDLTKDVLDYFQDPKGSPIRQTLDSRDSHGTIAPSRIPAAANLPLDQVFNAIKQEYGQKEVNNAVTHLLEERMKQECSRNHEIVAKISANKGGQPQIVTTNFDTLFETVPIVKEDESLYVAPNLPNLEFGESVSGVSYLHGRLLSEASRDAHDYILSSSDFGYAYLAMGWATKFVRHLLETYTVVLLGYQAEDPPVRYLLEGLAADPARLKGRLFAFDQGEPELVANKWRGRAVTAISYPEMDKQHSPLWKSLAAWADRVEDLDGWRTRVTEIASKDPRFLEAHEKSQVVHLVGTFSGARCFATKEPNPPLAWLAEFDPHHLAGHQNTVAGSSAQHSLARSHSLNNDLQGSAERVGKVQPDPVLSRRGVPGNHASVSFLNGRVAKSFSALTPRLSELGDWIVRGLKDPIVCRWVASQPTLHPEISDRLRVAVSAERDFHDLNKKCWKILLDRLDCGDEIDDWARASDLEKKVGSDGWTRGTLQELRRFSRPVFKVAPAPSQSRIGRNPESWECLLLGEVLSVEVEFLTSTDLNVVFPEDVLVDVVNVLYENLLLGIEMLEWTGDPDTGAFSLYAENDSRGEHVLDPVQEFTLWIATLIETASKVSGQRLASLVGFWKQAHCDCVLKLHMFAWATCKPISGSLVTSHLMHLGQHEFWSRTNSRDLLFLLCSRWGDFSTSEKILICKRIIAGPDSRYTEGNGKRGDVRGRVPALWLRYLELHECHLPTEMAQWLSEQRRKFPDWNDQWVGSIVSDTSPRVGSVEIHDSPHVLDGVEIANVIDESRRHAQLNREPFRDSNPFLGLVRHNTGVALDAIRAKADESRFPSTEFTTLIQNWPEEFDPNLVIKLYDVVRELPEETMNKHCFDLCAWLCRNVESVGRHDGALALHFFDYLLECLVAAKGASDFGGQTWDPLHDLDAAFARSTLSFAMNTAIGKLAEVLIQLTACSGLKNNDGFSSDFQQRFSNLFQVPDDLAQHAVAVLTSRFNFLFSIDSDWVKKCILPILGTDCAFFRSAWNGIFYSSGRMDPDVVAELKAPYFNIFPAIYEWDWSEGDLRRAHTWMVPFVLIESDDSRRFSAEEISTALRSFSEVGRVDIVHFIGGCLKGGDDARANTVVSFLGSWPRQVRYKTERISRAFQGVLESSGSNFPVVFAAVKAFLSPIRTRHYALFRFGTVGSNEESAIAYRFPDEMLEFLDIVVSNDKDLFPHGLRDVLKLIVKGKSSLRGDSRLLRMKNLIGPE